MQRRLHWEPFQYRRVNFGIWYEGKALIPLKIRRETVVPLAWLASELAMGSTSNVSVSCEKMEARVAREGRLRRALSGIDSRLSAPCLLSVYERKSRLGKLYKLSDKGSLETAVGIVAAVEGHRVRSITYDNGLEFAMHGAVNELLGSESYFCKPYSS